MNDHVAQRELEQRNRLPTLMEVLGRRTLAPVDLFSFYIYMRDQQRSVDYLDFWLDVSQHMSLCRHYVRELRRSMLVDTPTLEKEMSTQSSQLLDNYGLDDTSSHPSSIEKRSQEQKVSQILRSEDPTKSKLRGNNIRAYNSAKSPDDYERSSANSMTSSYSQSGHGLRKVGTGGEYSEKSEHYHGQVITDSSPGQNKGTFHDAATRFTGQAALITRSVSGNIDKLPVLAPAVPITHNDDTSTALGRGVVAIHGNPNVTTVTSGPMHTTTTTTTTTRVLADGRTSTTTTTAYPINRDGSQGLAQPATAHGVGNTTRAGPTTTGLTGAQYTETPPRPSFMTLDHSSSRGPTGSNQQNSSSPGHTVSRPDLRASAEKILYTFILPGSEREIVLPQAMVDRMIFAIEEEGRDDPEVFDAAKEYVFQAMERDAFQGFLQAKALGNLVPLDILIRLIIGLLTLGAGFWAGYYFILRNKSRRVRCWVILPFTIGTYFLVSYQYKLDMITAYAGLSEYTWMNWSRVREPYVRRLLIMRANAALLLWVLAAVILCIIFIFVPGTNF